MKIGDTNQRDSSHEHHTYSTSHIKTVSILYSAKLLKAIIISVKVSVGDRVDIFKGKLEFEFSVNGLRSFGCLILFSSPSETKDKQLIQLQLM